MPEQIDAELKQAKAPKSPFAELKPAAVAFELWAVGHSVVQDVVLDGTIDPKTTLGSKWRSERLTHGELTVRDFLDQSNNRYFISRCYSKEMSLHVISWSGESRHPVGVTVGAHILGIAENHSLCDIRGFALGPYAYLTCEESQGTAILAALVRQRPVTY